MLGQAPAPLGGFKIDEVDGVDAWLWPDLAEFPSGHDGEQMRQTYGLFLQRLVLDMYRGLNQRTLGQVRGTNGGASSFPFVIYNDNYDFDGSITAVGNTGFAGVLWSPEVRGREGEDMLRRSGPYCFSPLALFNGWAAHAKPGHTRKSQITSKIQSSCRSGSSRSGIQRSRDITIQGTPVCARCRSSKDSSPPAGMDGNASPMSRK